MATQTQYDAGKRAALKDADDFIDAKVPGMFQNEAKQAVLQNIDKWVKDIVDAALAVTS